jgi:hypothetical protein
MSNNQKLKGVTPQAGSKRNQWRAQIVIGREVEYLGCFSSSEEAAKAYDNAAFYAGQTGRCRRTELNFPEDYAQEPYPPPTERTLALIENLEARLPNQRKTSAQLRHFPDRELVRGMVQQLAVARRAELAAKKTVDGLIAELQTRLSVDSKTVQQDVAFMENLEKNVRRLDPSQEEELRRLQKIYRPEAPNAATSQSLVQTAALK